NPPGGENVMKQPATRTGALLALVLAFRADFAPHIPGRWWGCHWGLPLSGEDDSTARVSSWMAPNRSSAAKMVAAAGSPFCRSALKPSLVLPVAFRYWATGPLWLTTMIVAPPYNGHGLGRRPAGPWRHAAGHFHVWRGWGVSCARGFV